ncbi:hypothetical protein FBU30_007283 [Linnemannia zychae]|nr:hypothetical protein FBU30_007283 [Linnemannia zychae]
MVSSFSTLIGLSASTADDLSYDLSKINSKRSSETLKSSEIHFAIVEQCSPYKESLIFHQLYHERLQDQGLGATVSSILQQRLVTWKDIWSLAEEEELGAEKAQMATMDCTVKTALVMLVSCSFIVPVPPIVVKSQQRLESILPYLPIPPSITSALTISTEPSDGYSDDPQHFSAIAYKGNHYQQHQRDYYYRNQSDNNYYYSKSGALVKSSFDSSSTLFSSATSTALQSYDDTFEYPSSTTCITIAFNPKSTFRFLRLRFFRKLNDGYRDDYYYRQNPSYGGGKNSSYCKNVVRVTPVMFTFPFPSYDENFPKTVQVTGTFDNWRRETPFLTKNEQEGRFEGEILVDLERLPEVYQEEGSTRNGDSTMVENEAGRFELPVGAKLRRKLIYKFVLDGQHYVTDAGQSLERDNEGNLNNIRFLENAALDEQQIEQEMFEAAKDALEEVINALDVKDGLMDGQRNLDIEDYETLISNEAADSSSAENQVPFSTDSNAIESTVVIEEKTRPILISTVGAGADDNREKNGDNDVATLQEDPVTASTTAMANLTFFGDHCCATIDQSVQMTESSYPLPSDKVIHSTSDNDMTASSSTLDDSSSKYSKRSISNALNDKSVAPLPLSASGYSKSRISHAMAFSDLTQEIVGQTGLPTTAVTISMPQLPSVNSMEHSKKNRTSGFWKTIKKVVA